ncbi:MAG: General stress protein 69 [Nitrospira sp.]|nr:General stress protein 69 [Nitrospira sp.]
MEYVELGKTGLKVSVAGLGCGGHSKLGQKQGASIESSVGVVHAAIDLGIDVIDTADTSDMELIVGRAIKDRRDSVLVSTKLHPDRKDGSCIDAKILRTYVEGALTRLHTDIIDIFYFHGLALKDYSYCVKELVPELYRLRERGLIRFFGATESWTNHADSNHGMLVQAVQDDCWDVLMTGFNMLNHSSNRVVYPGAMAKGIGIFVMYAVRDLLSRPELLKDAIQEAIDKGIMDPKTIDASDPLGFLVHEGGATSVVDAAYRFARHEPGVHTVLTGTGNIEHLRANVESINRGPLPADDRARLVALFGHLTHFTGNSSENASKKWKYG